MGGVGTKLVERNTTIPTQRSQVFSTAADNQTSVEIHIVQGERPMASDNKSLGRFVLEGIPPSPRGMPQVEVTFDIDANGILQVKAKEKTSGKEQSIRIEASSSLKEDEIKRMQQDAELHADEDKKKKELIEARNLAQSLTYTAEKAIKDAGDKISEDVKKSVETEIENVQKVMTGEDKDVIEKATESLSTAMQKIGEEMSKRQNDAPQTDSEAKPEEPKTE